VQSRVRAYNMALDSLKIGFWDRLLSSRGGADGAEGGLLFTESDVEGLNLYVKNTQEV